MESTVSQIGLIMFQKPGFCPRLAEETGFLAHPLSEMTKTCKETRFLVKETGFLVIPCEK